MNRIEQQLDLFASVNGSFKITKPIRLIEMFSGIGAQSKALEVLGIPFENWKTCEWAYNSICGYNAIHTKDKTDYSKDLTKQELIDYLQGNISTNYDEPCDVSKKPETWLRNCYNNVKATHDLMNICNVKGQDLEIDTNYHHIVSWSYPCQDLSAAGLGAGMKEGSGTRSSLCFEFLRIIKELTQEQRQATTLIMENVQQAVGSKNVYDFQQVEKALADLGYTNHIKILNLKDYGLPQNRERVFMVSCFGDYEFPAKVQLKYLLRDLLNRNVDEKYYLSDKMIEYITADNEKWTGNNNGSLVNKDIGCALNTAPGQRRCDASNYIADNLPPNTDLKLLGTTNGHQSGNVYDNESLAPTLTACDYKSPVKVVVNRLGGLFDKEGQTHQAGSIYDKNGLAPTLDTASGGHRQPIIFDNKALTETISNNEIKDGSFIDAYNRDVKNDIAGTITTRVSDSNNTFIAEEQTLKKELCNELIRDGKVQECDIVKHSFTGQIMKGKKKAVEKQGEMITLTTRGDCIGVVVKDENKK